MMEILWNALIAYPPSLLSLLLALLAPATLLVGIIATIVRKEGGRGLAIGTTAGPVLMVLIALVMLAFGASSGISDGGEACVLPSAAMRSVRLSDAISSSMWATAIAALLLTLLVPAVAFGSAVIWSIRNGRADKGKVNVFLVAAGVSGPCFLIGGAIAAKVSGFINMFGALAHVAADDRGAVMRQGVAENQSLLASSGGIAVLFLLGLAVASIGAVLAARKEGQVPGWVLGVAAAFAIVGLSSAALVHVRASVIDDIATQVAEWEAPSDPPP